MILSPKFSVKFCITSRAVLGGKRLRCPYENAKSFVDIFLFARVIAKLQPVLHWTKFLSHIREVAMQSSYRMIYLVRHGQYDMSVRGADGGGLTELGREQAHFAAKALEYLPIDQIINSTMLRAIQTADIIAEYFTCDRIHTDLVREAIPSIPPRYAAHFIDMMNRDPNFNHEAIHDDQQRADEAFDTFFIPPAISNVDQHDIIVCHGNIMRYLTCKALGVNVDTWGKLDVDHCGITTISIDDQRRMRLVSHNETRHIPLDKLSN